MGEIIRFPKPAPDWRDDPSMRRAAKDIARKTVLSARDFVQRHGWPQDDVVKLAGEFIAEIHRQGMRGTRHD